MDYTQYVLPFMGSTSGGNDFLGASRPFGMVKVGPDNVDGKLNPYSGYLPNGEHTGFSMMHLSGTGGIPMYGVVSQLPTVGDPTPSVPRDGSDTTEVGYYKSKTAQGVTVELGASEHAAMYQYTFPRGGGKVVVDLSHRLPSFRGQGLAQGFAGGNITVAGDRYEGSATYNNGYNRAPDWTVFFCGFFSPTPQAQLFTDSGNVNGNSVQTDGQKVGATFSFTTPHVTSRVGISFISSAQACRSVNREIPPKKTLANLVDETRSVWNEQVLSRVTTTETNVTNLQLLYSSLYHMHLLPSNRTGENPLWQSNEPYYDDIFTLWDIHRTSTPLLHILQPVAYTELLNSIIDVWRHEGYTPSGRSANYNGPVQGGTFSDQMFAEAYVKGLKGIDWDDAYAAMVTNAEDPPPNNHDPRAPDSSTKEGRGALPDWKNLGYISSTYSRAVSRAIDYSTNDFGLYQMALGLGRSEDATKYLNRSRNWRNHWNAKATSLGFDGFVVPRDASGFAEYDPASCCGYWNDPFYEASAWEYSFAPLHDIPHLIELCGGEDRFVERLNRLFKSGSNSRLYHASNEISFATPYLYNFAGRQDLSVSRSRATSRSKFKPIDQGLPGASDSGAMQSWLLWNMIGLYPLTGQSTFLIHSPWFEHLKLDLGGGKSLAINSTGGDQDTSIYVQSLRINGKGWKKSYLDWKDVFENGGIMEYELGPKPNNEWFSGRPLTSTVSSAASSSIFRRGVPDLGREIFTDTLMYSVWMMLLVITAFNLASCCSARRSR